MSGKLGFLLAVAITVIVTPADAMAIRKAKPIGWPHSTTSPTPTPQPSATPVPTVAPTATPTATPVPTVAPTATPQPTSTPTTACNGIRRVISAGGDNGFFVDGHGLLPGDTIVLRPGATIYSYFWLGSANGTASCPITIVNEGGQVAFTAGLAVEDSTYVHITGTGSSDFYGFAVAGTNRTGASISLTGRSAHIEVDHIDARETMYGIWSKMEADCRPEYQYPNWYLDYFDVHHLKISGMGQSAMYLGSTDPNGNLRGVDCNGVKTYPIPMRLGHWKIHDNIISDTNRSGIQLSLAELGTSEIYNNTVTNAGWELNTSQGAGIALGTYTNAYVHHNTIRNTFNTCILALGSNERFESNDVADCGYLGSNVAGGMAGIMVDTRTTIPVTPTTFVLQNNLIGRNTDAGIRIYKSFDSYTTSNQVCGNTGNIIADSGVTYSTVCTP